MNHSFVLIALSGTNGEFSSSDFAHDTGSLRLQALGLACEKPPGLLGTAHALALLCR
jgi:hypothetical protein